MITADRAVRVDPASGVSEEAEIAGEAGSRMFSVFATPATRPAAGVVICSPILAEAPNNYRREVMLSRRLASRGLSAVRFHYRGAGNSDGETAELSVESMEHDMRAAADRLVERTGVTRLAFMGTRLASLVAAAGSRLFGPSPLALWEPVVTPAEYFGEILRAQLMSDLGGRSRGELLQELQTVGWLDVLGYRIERSLYQGACVRDLGADLGDQPRPVLLVQLARGGPRSHLLGLGRRLEERGFPVEAARLPNSEAWWFPDDQSTDAVSGADEAAIDVTVDWLCRRLGDVAGER